MEYFAKMIFEQWLREQDYNVDWFTNQAKDFLNDAEKYLNPEVVNKIYDMLCENGEETMREAFVAGFGYACKCLSLGKLDIGGVVNG